MNTKKIKELYNKGYSSKKIANILGYKSHVTILNHLKSLNIERRSPASYLKGSSRARKYSINENYFNELTPRSSYLLGLFFSDGWITNDGVIGLCMTDKNIIELVSKELNSTYPIKVITPKQGKILYELRFHSIKMKNKLITYGCIPRKSKTLKFPDLDERLFPSFIRGYFDGDGGIRISKNNDPIVYFCGTFDICETIRKYLNPKINSKAKVNNHSTIFRLQYCGRRIVKRLGNILYDNSELFIERKKKIFTVL